MINKQVMKEQREKREEGERAKKKKEQREKKQGEKEQIEIERNITRKKQRKRDARISRGRRDFFE